MSDLDALLDAVPGVSRQMAAALLAARVENFDDVNTCLEAAVALAVAHPSVAWLLGEDALLLHLEHRIGDALGVEDALEVDAVM